MLVSAFQESSFIAATPCAPVASPSFIDTIALDVQSAASWSSNWKVRRDYHLILIFCMRLSKKTPKSQTAHLTSTMKMRTSWVSSFVMIIQTASSTFTVAAIRRSSAESALSSFTLMKTALLWTSTRSSAWDNCRVRISQRTLIKQGREIKRSDWLNLSLP